MSKSRDSVQLNKHLEFFQSKNDLGVRIGEQSHPGRVGNSSRSGACWCRGSKPRDSRALGSSSMADGGFWERGRQGCRKNWCVLLRPPRPATGEAAGHAQELEPPPLKAGRRRRNNRSSSSATCSSRNALELSRQSKAGAAATEGRPTQRKSRSSSSATCSSRHAPELRRQSKAGQRARVPSSAPASSSPAGP